MDLEYHSVSGWLFLGLMTGLGPCLAHQLLILLPCLGMAQGNKRWRAWAITAFTIGRAGMYSLLGLSAGLFGFVVLSVIGHDRLYLVTQVILGSLLIVLALVILFYKHHGFCRIGSCLMIFRTGHTMFLVGALTALTPCPALFGLFIYSAATGQVLLGMINGLIFALGTSLVPVLAGLSLNMLDRVQKYSNRQTQVLPAIGGFVLFGYGLHLLLRIAFEHLR